MGPQFPASLHVPRAPLCVQTAFTEGCARRFSRLVVRVSLHWGLFKGRIVVRKPRVLAHQFGPAPMGCLI